MKRTASAAITALVCTTAAASHAALYIHDSSLPVASSSVPTTLSPIAARCLIAQRAGVLQFHAADLSGVYGDETVAVINEYGVRTPLTGESASLRRATILVEDLDALDPPIRLQRIPLDAVPSLEIAHGLFVDLYQQSELSVLSQGDVLQMLSSEPKRNSAGDIFYVTQAGDSFTKLLTRLVSENVHVTTLALSRTAEKGHAQWGTYEMPDAQLPLHKRSKPPSGKRGGKDALASANFLSMRQETTYNGSLPGILPTCYTSQSACQSNTLNCTGHGECIRKSPANNGPAAGPSAQECYACQCRITTSENVRGQKKTTYWGGPACQKRDVSSAFWLIALFSVGMIFLISFGIGQLWSIGEEELPSVIGAGVSGPVRRS